MQRAMPPLKVTVAAAAMLCYNLLQYMFMYFIMQQWLRAYYPDVIPS